MRHREEGIDDATYNKRLEEAVGGLHVGHSLQSRALRLDSNLAMTLWQLAESKEKNGGVKDREEGALKKGAVDHYEEALRPRWDHFDARIGYAQILGEMAMDAKKKGHTAEAEQRFAQAMKHLKLVVQLRRTECTRL